MMENAHSLDKLFKSLLEIKSPAELRLTLLILARATRTGDSCPAISYAEFRSDTGLAPATIARGLKDAHARGYILRQPTKRKEPARYRVIWERLGMSPDGSAHVPDVCSPKGISQTVEFYFTNTGFLDLLPQATVIAQAFGYGENEMIHAVCLTFDKQRTDPPTRNRTGWFLTVYREKLAEAQAQIQAYEQRRNRTG
jgi:hypothetical protein